MNVPKLKTGIPRVGADTKRPMSIGKQALTPPVPVRVPRSTPPKVKPKQPRLRTLPSVRGLGGLKGL